MNAVFFIAKRYAFSKSKTKAINIITAISSVGIVVSGMALFVVLSIFSGLEQFTLSFVYDSNADLSVYPTEGKSYVVTEKQKQGLRKIEGVEAYSLVVEEQVVFLYNERQQVATLKAVDSNYAKVVPLQGKIIAGSWISERMADVVFGNAFGQQLSMGVYSNENILEALAMLPGEGMITTPEEAYNRIPLSPVGIYMLDNVELDAKYVFANLSLGQDLLGFSENQVSKIEIKLSQNASEKEVKRQISELFGGKVSMKNRIEENESLYKMLQTERSAIYLIFSLIIVVTLFCLSGALIMMILEKKNHFKTLFDIGFTQASLRKIILYQGLILSFGGALIGIVLGVVLAYLQQKNGWLMVSETMPYPVYLEWSNLFVVIATLLILGFVASFFAASRLRVK